MALRFSKDYEGVDFEQVAELLRHFGLTERPTADIEKAFRNSYVVVFVFDDEGNTVGCGRAISDGIMEAAIFNIALDDKYQHLGLGRKIVKGLTDQLEGMIVTLYTHPKTFEWYKALGFSNLNTGFARFRDMEAKFMLEAKFIDEHKTEGTIFQEPNIWSER
jgi:N-acetylglutamate synthase-like GNAT family acetyltransferase